MEPYSLYQISNIHQTWLVWTWNPECGPEVPKTASAWRGLMARSAAAPKSDTLNQINKTCICCRNVNINAAKQGGKKKPTSWSFSESKKFRNHLFDIWSLWLDEQEATHNLQASCSTYITEWDYTFFFSPFASKCFSHIWQWAELHFN